MTPPFERAQANRNTRHHLLPKEPWWGQPKPREVSQLPAFIMNAARAPHDYLHLVTKPPIIPVRPVLNMMYEVGREYSHGWNDDKSRLDRMMDCFAGYAQATRSPEQAHGTLAVMASLESQMSVIEMFKGLRPRYE